MKSLRLSGVVLVACLCAGFLLHSGITADPTQPTQPMVQYGSSACQQQTSATEGDAIPAGGMKRVTDVVDVAGEEAKLSVLAFTLSSDGTIPASGAQVAVTHLGTGVQNLLQADSTGTVRAELSPGNILIDAYFPSESNNCEFSVAEVVHVAGSPLTRSFQMRQIMDGARVLVLQGEEPLAGVVVHISDDRSRHPSVTSAEGMAEFANIPFSPVSVLVGDLLAPTCVQSVDMSRMDSRLAIIHLGGPSITLSVLDPFGLGELTCITLENLHDLRGHETRVWYVTPPQTIHAINLKPGHYILSIAAQDPAGWLQGRVPVYGAKVFDVRLSDADQTISHSLDLAAAVRLFVEDSAAHELSSARVRVMQLPGMISFGSSSGTTMWSEKMNQTLRIPVGEVKILIDDAEAGFGEATVIGIAGATVTARVRLFPSNHSLVLRVRPEQISEIHSIRFFNLEGQIVRTWQPGSVRVSFGGFDRGVQADAGTRRDLSFREINLGYYEGGALDLVVQFRNGEIFTMSTSPLPGEPITLEVH